MYVAIPAKNSESPGLTKKSKSFLSSIAKCCSSNVNTIKKNTKKTHASLIIVRILFGLFMAGTS